MSKAEKAERWADMVISFQKARLEREQARYLAKCALSVITGLCVLILVAKI